MDCNDSGIGSLKICVGSANKKLETQQDQICQAFLFNLQFTNNRAEMPNSNMYSVDYMDNILDLHQRNRDYTVALSTLLESIVSSFKDADTYQSHSH